MEAGLQPRLHCILRQSTELLPAVQGDLALL
jgi:hypothetical protein